METEIVASEKKLKLEVKDRELKLQEEIKGDNIKKLKEVPRKKKTGGGRQIQGMPAKCTKFFVRVIRTLPSCFDEMLLRTQSAKNTIFAFPKTFTIFYLSIYYFRAKVRLILTLIMMILGNAEIADWVQSKF